MNNVFITGASRGIGKAIAVELLKKGNYSVYGISRSNSIQHHDFHFIKKDLSKGEDITGFRFPEEDWDKVVLINNAGTLGEIGHNGDLDNSGILSAYTLNVIAPHILMNQFIKQFSEQRCKKLIINITSGAANSTYDGWSVYCASKSAINRMTEVAANEQELANSDHHCKIYAIAPGVVETQMQEIIRSTSEEDFSNVGRFRKLKEEAKLYSSLEVARRFVKYIESPEIIDGLISRIVLE